MSKALDIKKIYIDGYARTESFEGDFRLSKVLQIVEQLIPTYPQRILDVGCGDGAFVAELGKRLKAKEIFGIDISPNAVNKSISYNIKVSLLDIDERNLPFEANVFDFIICGSLIELVLDPDHLLMELYRVLSPKGYLIVTFPNLCSWASRIAVLLGFHPYYDIVSRKYDIGKLFIPVNKYKNKSKGFIRLYTLYSFIQLTKLYGFKIIKSYGARANGLPKIISGLDRFFSQFPSLAFQVICLIKKI